MLSALVGLEKQSTVISPNLLTIVSAPSFESVCGSYVSLKFLLESWSDKLGNIERTPCHRQAHHPKPSSRGFRRPLCLVSRHQGLEGTPPRPKEGEEHQAQ